MWERRPDGPKITQSSDRFKKRDEGANGNWDVEHGKEPERKKEDNVAASLKLEMSQVKR